MRMTDTNTVIRQWASVPMSRFVTDDRIMPDISRLHSATAARDRLSDNELTHVGTER